MLIEGVCINKQQEIQHSDMLSSFQKVVKGNKIKLSIGISTGKIILIISYSREIPPGWISIHNGK